MGMRAGRGQWGQTSGGEVAEVNKPSSKKYTVRFRYNLALLAHNLCDKP